jgi:hypothetical protein
VATESLEGSAGGFARRRFAERRRWWRRRFWWVFPVVALIPVAIALPIALLTHAARQGFWIGFALGAGVGAAMVIFDSPPCHIERWRTGADGEKATAHQLRPLTSTGWKLYNDVATGHGNIDHVPRRTSWRVHARVKAPRRRGQSPSRHAGRPPARRSSRRIPKRHHRPPRTRRRRRPAPRTSTRGNTHLGTRRRRPLGRLRSTLHRTGQARMGPRRAPGPPSSATVPSGTAASTSTSSKTRHEARSTNSANTDQPHRRTTAESPLRWRAMRRQTIEAIAGRWRPAGSRLNAKAQRAFSPKKHASRRRRGAVSRQRCARTWVGIVSRCVDDGTGDRLPATLDGSAAGGHAPEVRAAARHEAPRMRS